MSQFKLTSVHLYSQCEEQVSLCKLVPQALLGKVGLYLVLLKNIVNLWLISQKQIQLFEEQFNSVYKIRWIIRLHIKENGPLFRFYSARESCTRVQPSAKDGCRSETAFGCSCTSFHRRKINQYSVVGEHLLSLEFRPAPPKLKPAVKVQLPADVCRDAHLLSSLCEQIRQILYLWDLDPVWRDQGRCSSQHPGLLKEVKGKCVSETLSVGSAGSHEGQLLGTGDG